MFSVSFLVVQYTIPHTDCKGRDEATKKKERRNKRKPKLTKRSERANPRARQGGMLGEAVEQVRANGRGSAERREAGQSPAKGDADPGQVLGEALTEEDQAGDAEDPRRVDAPEAVFRVPHARVPAQVAARQEVVEPVAEEFGAEGADHGGEVEECDGGVAEEVWWWLDELGDCADEADGPHGAYRYEAEGCFDVCQFVRCPSSC